MTAQATPPSAGPVTVDHAEPRTDGRRRRRDRNRLAVVDTLLGLYAEGNLRPSSAEIAERAGLSPRSLFRYFDDVDDLYRAAIERQVQLARPLFPVNVALDAPLEERVEALVDQRLRLFAAIGSAATVVRLGAPFQQPLHEQLTRSRALLRGQVGQVLALELTALGQGGSDALAAVDVLLSFESLQLLRHDQGLSVASLRRVLSGAVSALVAGTGQPE